MSAAIIAISTGADALTTEPTKFGIDLGCFCGRSLVQPILPDSSVLRPGANGLCCAVPGCGTCRYLVQLVSPHAHFICKHHRRQDQVQAVRQYSPERKEYDPKKDREDARVHFQDHVPHAIQQVDTSASLRWLAEPKRPPEFSEPTVEELERLRAANAEYDRRVEEARARTAQIVCSYQAGRQNSLLHQLPPTARSKKRNPVLSGAQVDHDRELHARTRVIEFQDRPTEEQKQEWDLRVREAMRHDYLREREQAELTLRGCIKEIHDELRACENPVRSAELRQRIVELLLLDPFHVSEPKSTPEIASLETEFRHRGLTRIKSFFDEEGALTDVFDVVADDLALLPRSQKKRAWLTLEQITKTYIQHSTETRQRRTKKLIRLGDRATLRDTKDFKHLSSIQLVLNEGLEPEQVALVTGEKPETVKKRAYRLYKTTGMYVAERSKVA